MALKLNGKDDRLARSDFQAAARTIGLMEGEADRAMTELAERVAAAAPTLRLPAFTAELEGARAVQDKMVPLMADRCAALEAAR